MGLSGQKLKRLTDALLDAFPDNASLEQMLSFELDKKLDAIVVGANYLDVVFKLIKKAEAQNWIEDLIYAARKSNPGNLSLKAIAEELLANHSLGNGFEQMIAVDCLQATEQALYYLIDPARIRKHWNKDDERWAKAANVSLETLRQFWNRELIIRKSFIAICHVVNIEDWKAVADFNKISVLSSTATVSNSPAVYDQETWVERSAVTEFLLDKLKIPLRILFIAGITGIGKTALAERLIISLGRWQALPSQGYKKFCRLNLDNSELNPDFLSSGTALLRVLGEEPTLEDQKDPKNLLVHLLQILREQPYCVQIDSLEHLLVGNNQEGWSDFRDSFWQDLFHQLLAGNQCQSQLIITTQDIPGEMATIGSFYPQFWYCESLQGLSKAEQLELFQKCGLPTYSDYQGYLERIGQLYEGHPLVLRVIAADINACGGDVIRYWQQCRFEELAARNPFGFSRQKLKREVKQRVEISLKRLPQHAYQLLCRASVYRRSVPESFWLVLLFECSEKQKQAALNLLKSYAFVREDWKPDSWFGINSVIPICQHNLVRSVAYNLLSADKSALNNAEFTAAKTWLSDYQPDSGIPNFEKVRGYLEAFHHYCQISNWEDAGLILVSGFSITNNCELHTQLRVWGYYYELIQLHKRVLFKLTPKLEVTHLRSIGGAYYFLGQYSKAIETQERCLEIACQISDCFAEGRALKNIGVIYFHLAKYSKALELYNQSITILRLVDDHIGEGFALKNIGNIHYILGNYSKALIYLKESLRIFKQEKSKKGESETLNDIGNIYCTLGKYTQAIDFYNQSLLITKEISSIRVQGKAFQGLGLVYYCLKDYEQALKNSQISLHYFREIGYQHGQLTVFNNFSLIYADIENHEKAIYYAEKQLKLSCEIGDYREEAIAKMNSAESLMKLEKYSEASTNISSAWKIFWEIGDKANQSKAMLKFAKLQYKLNQSDIAQKYCNSALQIAAELGIVPLVEECQKFLLINK